MKPLPNKPTNLRRGFTLVEVLMVLGIMGILTLVTMPSLVKSIRGNRLRVGARTLVMAGNYARTMAILKNQDMKLTLDKAANSVSVDPLRETLPASPEPGTGEAAPPASSPPLDAPSEPPETQPSAAAPTTLSRQLDAVRITEVTVDNRKGKDSQDTAIVIYRTNGRCNPYEVHLQDEYGSRMVITVDAVASPKVKKEGE